MTLKILKNDRDHKAALARAEQLVSLDPVVGTEEANELEVLAVLIADYESKYVPMPLPDPLDAIRFRMEQMNLSQRDLVPYIGSKSRVSEVLASKRRLTLDMIRSLSSGLGIPLRVLVHEAKPESFDVDEPDPRVFPLRAMNRHGYFGAVRAPARLRAEAGSFLRDFFAPLGPRPAHALRKQTHHVRSGRSFDQYALYAWTAQVMRRALSDKPPGRYQLGCVDDDFMRQVAQLSWSSQGPLLAREFLAQHGISLVVERHLPQTYLDGAALLLNQNHAAIGVTLRYNRLDNFWYCLMHELVHVRLHLRHEHEGYFDDLDAMGSSGAEREADDAAREALVPEEAWRASAACTVRSPDAAISLARKLTVHPAVVAGRMRYESKDFTILSALVGQGSVRRLFPEFQTRPED